MGALFFTFQIYCDFSGYSDIALGTARLLGIELLRNFAFPYFSRDIAEFWRRWHISLSSWFRDYLYIPLGGSKGGTWMKIRNTFIIFIVSGFWHGANWTFIVWGLLNAIYFLPLLLLKRNRDNLETVAQGKYYPHQEISLIYLPHLHLRYSPGFSSEHVISDMLLNTFQIYSLLPYFSLPEVAPVYLIILTVMFMTIEWLGREQQFALAKASIFPKPVRWILYYSIVIAIFTFTGKEQQIYLFSILMIPMKSSSLISLYSASLDLRLEKLL
jgi:alginate O-acetyltransferase complex protein AlgI